MSSLKAPPGKPEIQPRSITVVSARLTSIDAALFAVACIWGINFVVLKLSFTEIAPLAFNVMRLTLAALLLLLLLLISEGWKTMPKMDGLKLIGLGLLGHALYQIPFVLGLDRTTAGNSSLLIATIPVWTALLARFLGWERISWRVWTGIFLSFTGVLLVTYASCGFSLGSRGFWGDLLTLGAAACWAGYTVFSKDLLQRYSPLRLSALSLTAGVLGLWIIAFPQMLQENWTEAPGWIWAAMIYSGVLSIALAYVVWAAGIQRVGAARTAVYNNLVPVVTFVVAYFAMNQPIFLLQAVGGAIVLVGVWLTIRAK